MQPRPAAPGEVSPAALEPPAASVEVSPAAFAPAVPTADPPSGDMRPLDTELQPPGSPTPNDIATSGEYVATPIPPAAGDIALAGGPIPDEPILPTSLDDNALRDAVGAPRPAPRPKRAKTERLDDDGLPKPGGRKTLVIAAVAAVVGLGIAALVLLGRVSSARYVIACSTTQVTAEQGRSFPPWGSRPLTGPEWKPIALPANAECKPRETDDIGELGRWYLDVLVDRASTTLTARDLLDSIQPNKPNPLDFAAEQLNQALLLSRSPDRRDQRKEVERLLGDVQYWRASVRLRDASAALVDASRQFDAAAAQRPRHVTDAAEWATFLRRLAEELRAGPAGVQAVVTPGPQPGPQPGEHVTAPMGTALPVEPEGSGSEPVETPDAGLPTGGVLL
ncbi:MAG TPA: hypothetical protein VFV99_27905 [Kofleriaceae bacterium]|nr:hypothetical protein [Kofleriaceae bacterium]